MAEFMILKKPHWATIADVTLDDGPFPITKYNARQMPGDITSAKPDGFYRVEALGEGLHGWNRETWNLVRLKGLSMDTVARFADALVDSVTHEFKRKWKYYLDGWDLIAWTCNMVTINGVTVQECYYDVKTAQINNFIRKVTEKVVL